MPDQLYNWRRFWFQREAPLQLDDQGYLYDPEGPLGAAVNPHAVTFDALSALPCLALLGEPGMGKSTALRDHVTEVRAHVDQTNDVVLSFNLRAYQTDARLHQAIFGLPTFQAWATGSYHLYLFLDSLDECLLQINSVAALLADELVRYPAERLSVRIACRTAEWPLVLEQALQEHWGEDAVGVFDLAPLRRSDVATAAMAHGLPSAAFLTEVEHVGAVPLAIKPITLNFLIKNYRRHGHLPARQAELYADGCRLLCEEHSQSRRDARLTGNLSADQRLHIGEYLAFLTIFANRSAVWTGVDDNDLPAETIAVRTLSSQASEQTEVNEAAIKEVLATGLFTMRGVHESGWSHQTYAEFLAARYLEQRNMPLAQMMGLLVHPDDPAGRLVPQLHETAAWLAGMRQEVFDAIMACDPEVLLRSDVAKTDAEDRAALVAALLNLFDQELLLDRDYHLNRRFRKLAHPALTEQLRPYIRDIQKGFLVRRVAIDIAEACEQRELQGDLVDVALDPHQPHHTRVQAAWALVRIGDRDTKEKLKPLVFGQAGTDTDAELRGCGLLATWPELLTAEELFSALESPEHEIFGSYASFLTSHCMQHLRPADLPIALQWVAKLRKARPWDSLNRLADEILELAWEYLEAPGVLAAFAEAAVMRVEQHLPIIGPADQLWSSERTPILQAFYERWRTEASKRRHVFELVLPKMVSQNRTWWWLIFEPPPLILNTDVDWLIGLLQHSQDQSIQAVLAQLIARLIRVDQAEQFELAYVAAQQNQTLAIELRHIFGSIELQSEEAVRLRSQYEAWQELSQSQEQEPLDSSPALKLQERLDECEAGDLDAWWRLNLVLCVHSTRGPRHGELQAELRALPGWQEADEPTRARIIRAAQRYVLEARDDPDQWRTPEGITIYRPSFAGYRAFLLLLHEDHNALAALPPAVWCSWAPIIVAFPAINSIDQERPHQTLVALAYLFARDETIAALIYEIDKDNRNGRHPSILWKFERCWDAPLAASLLDKARDPALCAASLGYILGEVLQRHGSAEAQEFAASLVTLPIPADEEGHRKALQAAHALMTQAPDAGWSALWPVIVADPAFGRELIEAVAHDEDRSAVQVGRCLNEEQLADFYLWVVRQFPHQEDPRDQLESTEWHAITPRESIGRWRDVLLQVLKAKGTPAAVNAIQHLQAALPELDRLRWTVLEAQAITRHQTWTPLSPQALIALTRNREARLVQNGDHLLGILLESLDRLETLLRAETPVVFRLWNETPIYRPKDEERLSDEIKQHFETDLRQRGIVANREVVIRPTVPGFRGERTDIKVDAVSYDDQQRVLDVITVIVEVKGCWNSELPTAMREQLRDRYLKENTCQHGLYLVGWFNSPAWDSSDYREQAARQLAPALDTTRDRFAAQAMELSQAGITLRSYVLNVSLPQDATPPNKEKRGGPNAHGSKRRSRCKAYDEMKDGETT